MVDLQTQQYLVTTFEHRGLHLTTKMQAKNANLTNLFSSHFSFRLTCNYTLIMETLMERRIKTKFHASMMRIEQRRRMRKQSRSL